jgi:hypothetical protein
MRGRRHVAAKFNGRRESADTEGSRSSETGATLFACSACQTALGAKPHPKQFRSSAKAIGPLQLRHAFPTIAAIGCRPRGRSTTAGRGRAQLISRLAVGERNVDARLDNKGNNLQSVEVAPPRSPRRPGTTARSGDTFVRSCVLNGEVHGNTKWYSATARIWIDQVKTQLRGHCEWPRKRVSSHCVSKPRL